MVSWKLSVHLTITNKSECLKPRRKLLSFRLVKLRFADGFCVIHQVLNGLLRRVIKLRLHFKNTYLCGKWGRCEILGDSFAWGMSQARQRSGQSPRRKSEKSFSRAELKISRIKKANRWFQGKKSEAFFNAKIFFRPLKILRKSKILVQYESFSPNINSWKGTLNLTMPDTGGLTIMGQN